MLGGGEVYPSDCGCVPVSSSSSICCIILAEQMALNRSAGLSGISVAGGRMVACLQCFIDLSEQAPSFLLVPTLTLMLVAGG